MPKSWLLTWNPKKTVFPDLSEKSKQTQNSKLVIEDWSWVVQNNRTIQYGDKVFLTRRKDRPGLVGSGIALSQPKEGPHSSDPNKTTNWIAIGWTALVDPDTNSPLLQEELDSGSTSQIHWTTQRSGISIGEDQPGVVDELEKKWHAHLKREFGSFPNLKEQNEKAWKLPLMEDPYQKPPTFKKCEDLLRSDKLELAIECFSERISKGSDNPFTNFLLRGEAYLSNENPSQARKNFNECIRLDPKTPYSLEARARTYSAEKKYDQAIKDCTEAIGLDPKDGLLWCCRGEIYEEKGDSEKAEADYKKARELGCDC